MGTQDSGPTLQGLVQRLEALERENALWDSGRAPVAPVS